MENQNNNEQPKNENAQQPTQKKGWWSKVKSGLWYAVAVIAGAGVGTGATYGVMKRSTPAAQA